MRVLSMDEDTQDPDHGFEGRLEGPQRAYVPEKGSMENEVLL